MRTRSKILKLLNKDPRMKLRTISKLIHKPLLEVYNTLNEIQGDWVLRGKWVKK